MTKRILPSETIGILGGGQLGRMMAIAAKEMGYRIAVLDPQTDSPCGQVADQKVIASYDSLEGAKELVDTSSVITYEFENIDNETATWIEENGNLPQGSKLLTITQDRKFEKGAISEFGIPVAPYRLIDNEEDLNHGVQELGLPAVLKTCRGGYDGKGQIVIKEEQDIKTALEQLVGKTDCILESWVPFKKEISVIVTRSVSGETSTFPVAENIHKDNILHQTIVPARISTTVEENAKKIAIHLADSLNLVGTLAVEMFLTEEDEIFVNELAPRPHNSGHYTLDACETSQFQQHIRAVCNWPLGKTDLLKPVVMVNILGEHLEGILQNIDQFDDCKLHLYGKEEAKEKRKMGHLNVLADSVEEALEKVEALNIW
jgi:5-(carboxyamino)imidazole ribonucleotide synthase